MRRLLTLSRTWLVLVLLAGMSASVVCAQAPAAPSAGDRPADVENALPDDPEAAFEKGLEQERSRNWPAAIELYHQALERWPSRVDFSRRLRLCEIHFKLHRRYSDTSFRTVLLRLPHEQVVDLYDEVLERIQSNYVDQVPFEPLVRHGLDNLEVALRDPYFVKTNAPSSTPERVSCAAGFATSAPGPTECSRPRVGDPAGSYLQRDGSPGDRHVVHSGRAGVHLRRLRRA